ncbi:MAG: PilC/PilY family type IV pilus protein [Hydrogenophaga sp.]|nr:PilC/PilY family type IV pilus protein [Hydrogenophaga sp.]
MNPSASIPVIKGLITFGCLSFQLLAQAAPLSLAQSPPGAAREPAPNIIVSVDDSGSMGTTGIATLKAALTQTFAASNVVDDRIRLAWQSMNRCGGIPNTGTSCNGLNGMKPLSGSHRTNFMSWVNGLTPNGGTPSHYMLDEAGQYLSKTGLGINSPWAAIPGQQELPVLSCRKSFHIFMTDGNWNSAAATTDVHVDTAGPPGTAIVRAGNADGTTTVLGDGTTTYSVTATQTRLYRDTAGTANLSTLSDLAFYYWSRDLQPSLTNNVRPSINITGTQNFGTSASPAILDSFWNPRNNPATWQHMVNYTIGFDPDGPGGAAGADQWAGSPVWGGDTFSGDLANLIRGSVLWSTPFCSLPIGTTANPGGNSPCNGANGYSQRSDARKMELWHAALNSRGRFVPAPNASALVNAFKTILDDILQQTAKPLVSIAASGSRLRTDGFVYVAGFNSEQWSGELSAYSISATNTTVNPTPTWKATTLLDTSTFVVNDRLILTSPGGTITSSFRWGSLTTAMQADLSGTDGTTTGSLRVDYLRGVRTGEKQNGGQFRDRASRLGDIVNSNIWLTGKPARMSFEHLGHEAFRTAHSGRTPTLYVGANDGMLHAFNANTGRELMAYVPRGVYANLRDYTLESYTHKYFVDGHPFTGDADTSGRLDSTTTPAVWRTMLVSGLGGGGKGYVVLDVTSPTTAQVVVDNTMPTHADVGHIFSQPVVDPVSGSRSEQIVKMNNGRWAVVMGNGYNSTNERPVLLIQYLDGDRSMQPIIATTTDQSNGLSAPRLIDINGDGKVDIAYAGDLQGNLWKFNLTSSNPSGWARAGSGPLFTAEFPSGTRQPITAAPLWMAPPQGGIQVAFGTGRNVTTTDRANTSTQSIYSVWDDAKYTVSGTGITLGTLTSAISGRSQLVQQSVGSTVTTSATTSADANTFYNTTENDVIYTGVNARRGWFMDLPVSRERVLNNPVIYEGQKIMVSSNVPTLGSSGETCDLSIVAEDNFISVLNMFSGKPSQTPVFATTDTSMNMNKASRTRFGTGDYVTLKTNAGAELISPQGGNDCPEGQLCTKKLRLTTGSTPGARADWREVRK